ncbi:hypothetical protein PanWU01x14_177980 [Parasponia andersonii]|uniref:Uncharacterized protein n=1 Tax=Parasponia andersonii TaxID=3476 RepID=A0A2P5C798_PARAD|nr:hypothetical protein PanWU01x14_177980 [Parasponia andersonii]
MSNISPKSSSTTHPKGTKHHLSSLLSIPTGPFHIGTSSASSLIVDAYLNTDNATDPTLSHPTYQNRQPHYQAPRHTYADDPVRKVTLDAPELDGRLDPFAFLHWLDQINKYFDWYSMTKAQRISMARIKLVDDAKYFWKIVVRNVDLRCRLSILTWDEMRDVLKTKYAPPYYMNKLLN